MGPAAGKINLGPNLNPQNCERKGKTQIYITQITLTACCAQKERKDTTSYCFSLARIAQECLLGQ